MTPTVNSPPSREQRSVLAHSLQQARNATATLATLSDPDPAWEGHVNPRCQVLCDELLALRAGIRDFSKDFGGWQLAVKRGQA